MRHITVLLFCIHKIVSYNFFQDLKIIISITEGYTYVHFLFFIKHMFTEILVFSACIFAIK